MARIEQVRSVLLSGPYEDPETNGEALIRLPSGFRTTGLVEIVTDAGLVGLGEGYLAVFAPLVFRDIVSLLEPVLVGRDPDDEQLIPDIEAATNYWSRQGAARHVVSAIDTALHDVRAQARDMPIHEMLGSGGRNTLQLYGSGGDALRPDAMEADIEACNRLGLTLWKIRARPVDPFKARWSLARAKEAGLRVGIDMVQSLAVPALTADVVAPFAAELRDAFGDVLAFLEDPVGNDDYDGWKALRRDLTTPVAGGEVVTTPDELLWRIANGFYDWVQPDASVVGGIGPAARVTEAAVAADCLPVVHAWGGPVAMLANYHAALAAGGTLAEWPLTNYPLRDALVVRPWAIEDGRLTLPRTPGLGARLTPEIEAAFPFRPDAVYACLPHKADIPPDSVWK